MGPDQQKQQTTIWHPPSMTGSHFGGLGGSNLNFGPLRISLLLDSLNTYLRTTEDFFGDRRNFHRIPVSSAELIVNFQVCWCGMIYLDSAFHSSHSLPHLLRNLASFRPRGFQGLPESAQNRERKRRGDPPGAAVAVRRIRQGGREVS